jgi:hypothetical protein
LNPFNSQATLFQGITNRNPGNLAPRREKEKPFQIKAAKIQSILSIIEHERINLENQYTWMEKRTDLIN